MVARVTLAEIDVVRMSVASALKLYRESVLAAQHRQPGYEGGYVLSTAEGKALVITFWTTAEDAEAGLASGFYDEQVRKFATTFRAPPGRELYDVSVAEPPSTVAEPPSTDAEPPSTDAAATPASASPAGTQPIDGRGANG